MALKFKGEIKYVEKYEKEGEQKKVYHKIGALFEREDGSLCVNIAGGGWANIYPPKAKGEDFKKLREDISRTDQVYAPQDDDSEIPF